MSRLLKALVGISLVERSKNMRISFGHLIIGSEYSRPQLAKRWGFKGYEAISRGIVTPSRTPYIILFITEEKQASLTQYRDKLDDGLLYIEGETRHTSDKRIIDADKNGDEIHLFYRKRHHSPFIYYGRIYMVKYTCNSDKPSNFIFAVD